MTPVTITPVFEFEPDAFQNALFRAAEVQNEAGHHFLAVVVAQTAVEAIAQSVFATLFGINVPRSLTTMNELLPDRSFMAKGTRMLWQELTGESITANKEIWKPYKAHVERRNAAAHGSIFGWPSGEPISQQDAEASIEAARAMTGYLLETLSRVMEELVSAGGERMAEEDQWRALLLIGSRPATPRRARAWRGPSESFATSEACLSNSSRPRRSFHPTSIARIESGLTEPTLTVLVTLSNGLGISTSVLIERARLDSIGEDS